MDFQPETVGHVRSAPKQKKDQEITTFPFQIDFTGKADLETYLQPEENEAGVISGTFRGRPLFAERVTPPGGFETLSATTNRCPNGKYLYRYPYLSNTYQATLLSISRVQSSI